MRVLGIGFSALESRINPIFLIDVVTCLECVECVWCESGAGEIVAKSQYEKSGWDSGAHAHLIAEDFSHDPPVLNFVWQFVKNSVDGAATSIPPS